MCWRLSEPGCRLLTLGGEGGIGKTRLALEVGARWVDDGGRVVFVDLQPVPSVDFLVSAVADALNLPQASQDDPWAHLLRYLRDKTLLLVLDNFEHLLEGVDLLSNLLRTAPQVIVAIRSGYIHAATVNSGDRETTNTPRACIESSGIAPYSYSARARLRRPSLGVGS